MGSILPATFVFDVSIFCLLFLGQGNQKARPFSFYLVTFPLFIRTPKRHIQNSPRVFHLKKKKIWWLYFYKTNITRRRMQQTSVSIRQRDPIRRSILTWRDSAQSTTFSFLLLTTIVSLFFFFQVTHYIFQKKFQIDKITLHTAGRFDTRQWNKKKHVDWFNFLLSKKWWRFFWGFILFKSRDRHRPPRHTVHHCEKTYETLFDVGTRKRPSTAAYSYR